MPHVPATVQLLRPRDDGSVMPAPRARAVLRAHVDAGPVLAGRRSLPQTLDLALELLRARFARMLLLGALAWIPVRALQPFVGQQRWFGRMDTDVLLGQTLGSLASMGGTALAQCFGAALLARVVHAELEGRELALGEALRFVLARLHIVIAIAVVTAAASVAGFCACVVPWVLVAWKFSLAPYVCVIEDRGLGASLSRSLLLTTRGFWRWVLLASSSLLIGLPFTGISALADYPQVRARALGWSGLSSGTYDLLLVLVSALLLGAATALHAAIFTIYYADARVRREGSDLEPQLAALRAGAGPEVRA